MRFPSLDQITQSVKRVIRLYPMELVAAITGTGAGSLLTYKNVDNTEHWLLRILMVAALALPSFLALTLRGRFRKLTLGRRILEYGIVVALLLLFFFSMSHPPVRNDVIRFFMLIVAAHLLVSCAGFLGRGSTLAFWQFNRYLFLRIITALIFSGVLFAGLAGALAAMDALFQLQVRDNWYGRVFVWIIGLFNTVFFLAGVPEDATELEKEQSYPKVLKVFTQFVLLPLVVIYLVILLAYEGKIIAQWRLPNGWVSNLIIAFGIVGILSTLLVYPIRSMEGNRWIKLFSRWFYILLLPLVVLMFVAIGTRVGHYGYTEERVFVLALAIWLGGISIYYLLRPEGDIRAIPFSLALLALILTTGPASAFQISRGSQRDRLTDLLTKHNLLENERAVKVKPGQKIPFKDKKGISSTVQYLLAHHGPESLEPYFKTDSLNQERWSGWDNTSHLMRSINLEPIPEYATRESATAVRRFGYSSGVGAVTITGYDVLIPFGVRYRESPDKSGLHTRLAQGNSLMVFNGEEPLSRPIYPRATMDRLVSKYGENGRTGTVPVADLQQQVQGKGCKLLVFYERIEGTTDKQRDPEHYEGMIFLKWE